MKYRSVFDIIGPIMVGPSSSHTAGAARIGFLARKLLGKTPDRADIHFFGSFAETYRGHATDVAVTGGLMGYDTSDVRIPDALALAEKAGLKVTFICEEAVPEHPNTMRLDISAGKDSISVTGVSLGGGLVQITEISGFTLKMTGESPVLLVFHRDAYGAIASVSASLSQEHINVSHMEVSRIEKGQMALMAIETDQKVPASVVKAIETKEHVTKVIVLE